MTKAKRENIAIILVIILVLGYVFYKCYSVTHIELETETAALTTVYETVDAKTGTHLVKGQGRCNRSVSC